MLIEDHIEILKFCTSSLAAWGLLLGKDLATTIFGKVVLWTVFYSGLAAALVLAADVAHKFTDMMPYFVLMHGALWCFFLFEIFKGVSRLPHLSRCWS